MLLSKRVVVLQQSMQRCLRILVLKLLVHQLDYLLGKVIASDVVDTDTGEILLSANTVITEESIEVLTTTKIKKIRYYLY